MYEALEQTRRKLASSEGRNEYRKRAGIEGTISQGVRRGTLSAVKIPGFGENTSSGSGDGDGNQYSAGSQLPESGTTCKNKSFPVFKISKLNWATVFHATFSFTTANENVYYYTCEFPIDKGRFRYWCYESANSLTWIPIWNHRLLPSFLGMST